MRWVTNLRELNKQTIKDSYPLTNIQEVLHSLQGATVFSSLDACVAFHTVRIEPVSWAWTEFISPFSKFQYIQMPFGSANAGSVYSWMLDLASHEEGGQGLLNVLPGWHFELQGGTLGSFWTFDTGSLGTCSSWNQDTTLEDQAVPVRSGVPRTQD